MKTIYKLMLGAAAFLGAGSALADNVGEYGPVAQVTVNGTQSDDIYGARGRLVIDEGQGFYRQYQWSGTACNGRNLSDADVANLLMALEQRRSVNVTPLWKSGAGTTRCLVAYRITAIEVPQ